KNESAPLWFAKMSSQARSLRINHIQIEVTGESLRRQRHVTLLDCYMCFEGPDGFFGRHSRDSSREPAQQTALALQGDEFLDGVVYRHEEKRRGARSLPAGRAHRARLCPREPDAGCGCPLLPSPRDAPSGQAWADSRRVQT